MPTEVLYWNRVPEDLFALVKRAAPPEWSVRQLPDSEEEQRGVLANADYLIVASDYVTDAMLDGAPRLKMAQHQGVGYEKVDVGAFTRRGIPFALTPEGTTEGVAEHVFALILSLYKRLAYAEHSLREGRWLQWELRTTSFEIAGKTIGIVGFGRIGQAVAARAAAFGAEVLFYDPMLTTTATPSGARGVDQLDELLEASDIITLHVPATSETEYLIDTVALSKMRSDAILINTARGSLVNEIALTEALVDGTIRGAGLDVFEKEPLPTSSPLIGLENVVLTPHISAGTTDAYLTKMTSIFENFLRHSRGEQPRNVISEPARMEGQQHVE